MYTKALQSPITKIIFRWPLLSPNLSSTWVLLLLLLLTTSLSSLLYLIIFLLSLSMPVAVSSLECTKRFIIFIFKALTSAGRTKRRKYLNQTQQRCGGRRKPLIVMCMGWAFLCECYLQVCVCTWFDAYCALSARNSSLNGTAIIILYCPTYLIYFVVVQHKCTRHMT